MELTRAMLQHSKASERMYNYVIIDFYDVMNDDNDGNNKKTKLGGGGGGGRGENIT